MGENLLQLLSPDRVDHDELLWLLHVQFGGAEIDPTDLKAGVAFPNIRNARIRVRVKGDRITEITRGPSFDEADVAALADEVRDKLLDGQTTTIHTRVIFSGNPVAGFFMAPGETFQLLPAPPQAPRPPRHHVADHPFLIQYPVVTSTDPFITSARSSRALSDRLCFLNAVLIDHISTIGPRTRQMWVATLDPSADTGVPDVRWGQEFYLIPDFAPSEAFSSPDAAPIPTHDQNLYYSRRATNFGDPFDLPDSFARDVQAFALLDAEKRRRFLRAGQWLMAAHEIRDRHTASWYIAQVAAIESLAHEDVPFVACPAGGKDLNPGPTARFKDFLERHAPGAGTSTQNNALYAVRSGLVHGTALLHHDSPFGFSLLHFATGEREEMDRLSSEVSVAMVNWLRDQASGNRGS